MTCDKGFESTVSRLYNSMCLSPLIQLDTHQISKWKPQYCNGLFPALFPVIYFTNMYRMLQLHLIMLHLTATMTEGGVKWRHPAQMQSVTHEKVDTFTCRKAHAHKRKTLTSFCPAQWKSVDTEPQSAARCEHKALQP